MDTITGYILAGGKSSRMGTDKGLLTLNGKTFVENLCDALKPIVGNNIVIVTSNLDYDFLGFTRIEDLVKDKGPVGGIYTALKYSQTKSNFILSVDAPLVSTELLQWIVENHKYPSLITQVQSREKVHPLIAIYDRELKNIFEESVNSNQLRLREAINKAPHQTLAVPEKWIAQVQNINTKEDYQNLAI